MSVICFSSLKGGVGKTSLSVNVAHAFAERGCEVLLIDTDPIAHSTRFFLPDFREDSPLAQLLLTQESRAESRRVLESAEGAEAALETVTSETDGEASGFSSNVLIDDSTCGLLETLEEKGINLTVPARKRLNILPASPSLRHFLWGKSAQVFRIFFPKLIEELRGEYDYIIVDTAPDFNVITRNVIANSQLVVMPTDSSEMGIYALEELVNSASHIDGPTWTIVRTLVNRQATTLHSMVDERLECSFAPKRSLDFSEPATNEFEKWPEDADANALIELFDERFERKQQEEQARVGMPESPIYLLDAIVYRTEEQNKLSLLRKTSFDSRRTSRLAGQYLGVARELEQILALSNPDDVEDSEGEYQWSEGMSMSSGA